ncbi:LysR family transcriptional regulator ArgP [Rhodalgimonas zhirmunskyi]|uniref:LysR family transcriptional regulator ArgP n=1 Tax=Rhodalgimonas zhirmunskyi TaxID=2964767 RepID=A0AAJ1X2N5_9RHOB|nr:LysR family transcriptional regulator ArgP [Rhodoalgimonas zhirmunskyi]MDQ2092513.1 LysR family transcriptional regulator ArgP [Rhodoalgimonas zhirmunskyi]
MQFDSRQLAALAAILRLGSFEAAAQSLGVTQSAISQRLKALEEQVGAVLVLRESPCRGTDAGTRLAAHAETVRLLEEDVSRDLGTGGATSDALPVVRIAVNADSIATWFLGALEGIDNVTFDLVVDDETHSADWLRRGDVIAAVTEHARPVQGCDVYNLGALRYVATASRDYVNRWFPDGVNSAAMAQAPMLRFSPKDTLQAEWIEEHFGAGLHPPAHVIPSSHGFIEASRRGIGWALNPKALVEIPIKRGRLQLLEKDAPLDRPLYWQVSRRMADVLAPLTAAVKQRASKTLVMPQDADTPTP